eukprot:2382686-Rhodomonas_salina.2
MVYGLRSMVHGFVVGVRVRGAGRCGQSWFWTRIGDRESQRSVSKVQRPRNSPVLVLDADEVREWLVWRIWRECAMNTSRGYKATPPLQVPIDALPPDRTENSDTSTGTQLHSESVWGQEPACVGDSTRIHR